MSDELADRSSGESVGRCEGNIECDLDCVFKGFLSNELISTISVKVVGLKEIKKVPAKKKRGTIFVSTRNREVETLFNEIELSHRTKQIRWISFVSIAPV